MKIGLIALIFFYLSLHLFCRSYSYTTLDSLDEDYKYYTIMLSNNSDSIMELYLDNYFSLNINKYEYLNLNDYLVDSNTTKYNFDVYFVKHYYDDNIQKLDDSYGVDIKTVFPKQTIAFRIKVKNIKIDTFNVRLWIKKRFITMPKKNVYLYTDTSKVEIENKTQIIDYKKIYKNSDSIFKYNYKINPRKSIPATRGVIISLYPLNKKNILLNHNPTTFKFYPVDF